MVIKYKDYTVKIIRKNNKHTYLYVLPSMELEVRTNYKTSLKEIEVFLEECDDFIENKLAKIKKTAEKFYYLGVGYDLILDSNYDVVIIKDNKIYARDIETLKQWFYNQANDILWERFLINYNKMLGEKIPYPRIRINKLQRSYGLCYPRKGLITLGVQIIHFNYEIIDYLIIHELCHFLVPNHSKLFWHYVSFYCPNYIECKKQLRETTYKDIF